ncbi:MAG TPA: hypothetical protein DCQ84_16405 [Candidatus Competibacteraceae bacterium]|nr:hypothetical protein [Candidatus Competibacteraceae bacterium]
MDISNSVQSLGGDNFRVDGQTIDFETLILSVQTQRANLLESQLADQAQEIQKRNDMIAKVNDMLNEAKNVGARSTDTNPSTGSAALRQFLVDNKIPFGNGGNPLTLLRGEWDAVAQGLKNLTDKLNSQSQMDMIRLQSLMNKRDQAFEMMTNVLQKTSKLNGDIVANMR